MEEILEEIFKNNKFSQHFLSKNGVLPFNVDEYVAAFWKIDVPEINKVDINVHGPLKLGIVGGLVIAL